MWFCVRQSLTIVGRLRQRLTFFACLWKSLKLKERHFGSRRHHPAPATRWGQKKSPATAQESTPLHEPNKARPFNRTYDHRIKVSSQCKQASAKSMPMHDPPEGNSAQANKAQPQSIKTAARKKQVLVSPRKCMSQTQLLFTYIYIYIYISC